MRRYVFGYPGVLWVFVIPVWLLVLVVAGLPYAGDPPIWVVVCLITATTALPLRWVRWLAMVAPVVGLVARSPEASVSSIATGVAGLAGAVAAVALLDGWDLAGTERRRTAMATREGAGVWARERLAPLATVLAVTLLAALAWALVADRGWGGGAWLVMLTPALLAIAAAAATQALWWRPSGTSRTLPRGTIRR